jgi:hypothetical protein
MLAGKPMVDKGGCFPSEQVPIFPLRGSLQGLAASACLIQLGLQAAGNEDKMEL